MACGCRKSAAPVDLAAKATEEVDRAGRVTYRAPATADFVLHEVKPGESCIYCAEKHVSIAYAAFMSGTQTGLVIGEMELARRHTMLEYGEISRMVAEVERAACRRGVRTAAERFRPLLEALAKASQESPEDGPETEPAALVETPAVEPDNPLVGEIHACAAWRLAFEIGYMVPNRQMILGDLALAREGLARFDGMLREHLRDLRHRVQTTRASDLDVYWPYAISEIGRMAWRNRKEWREEYGPGLDRYLGLDKEGR